MDEVRPILEQILAIHADRLARAKPLCMTEMMSLDDFQDLQLAHLNAKLDLARHNSKESTR